MIKGNIKKKTHGGRKAVYWTRRHDDRYHIWWQLRVNVGYLTVMSAVWSISNKMSACRFARKLVQCPHFVRLSLMQSYGSWFSIIDHSDTCIKLPNHLNTFELRHDKTNKMTVRPLKTQVLSYPFSTQRRLWSDWADPPRLIWVFAVHTATLLVLSCRGSYMQCPHFVCLSLMQSYGSWFNIIKTAKSFKSSGNLFKYIRSAVLFAVKINQKFRLSYIHKCYNKCFFNDPVWHHQKLYTKLFIQMKCTNSALLAHFGMHESLQQSFRKQLRVMRSYDIETAAPQSSHKEPWYHQMSQLMRLWYLSHRRPAKAQAHMKYENRWRVQPKNQISRLTGWLCMRI